jgi:hypothetical protein
VEENNEESKSAIFSLAAGVGCCSFSLVPILLGIIIFISIIAFVTLGNTGASPEPSTFSGECDIKEDMMPTNMRTMFCEAAAQYKLSAASLAALFCRETGITNAGNLKITKSSFGKDLSANYREEKVDRCVRNSATATGPFQIIDISWAGVPGWSIGNVPDSQKGDDVCDGGACRGAKRDYDVTGHGMTRCIWGDGCFSQASLVFGKISSNAWEAGSACKVDIKNGKIESADWSIACITAIARAYYGGHGYEDRVVEPYKQLTGMR